MRYFSPIRTLILAIKTVLRGVKKIGIAVATSVVLRDELGDRCEVDSAGFAGVNVAAFDVFDESFGHIIN